MLQGILQRKQGLKGSCREVLPVKLTSEAEGVVGRKKGRRHVCAPVNLFLATRENKKQNL